MKPFLKHALSLVLQDRANGIWRSDLTALRVMEPGSLFRLGWVAPSIVSMLFRRCEPDYM